MNNMTDATAHAADADADKSNWTIKNFPVRVREKVIRAARQRGQSVPEWTVAAVELAAHMQERDGMFPPAQPLMTLERPGSLVALPAPPVAPAPVSLTELTEAMQAARGLADAAGVALPKTTVNHAFAILNKQLRTARGLKPRAVGSDD